MLYFELLYFISSIELDDLGKFVNKTRSLIFKYAIYNRINPFKSQIHG